jgi:hypothetical protein
LRPCDTELLSFLSIVLFTGNSYVKSPTLNKLEVLRFTGMAKALTEQMAPASKS